MQVKVQLHHYVPENNGSNDKYPTISNAMSYTALNEFPGP
jgi:hypothetical protein